MDEYNAFSLVGGYNYAVRPSLSVGVDVLRKISATPLRKVGDMKSRSGIARCKLTIKC